MYLRLILLTTGGLLTGLLPGSHGVAGAAAEQEANRPQAVAVEKVAVPLIRRLATYQFLKGERPLRGPLALARDAQNGDLVVTSFESGEVVILNQAGALLHRLGREAGLVTPYGVAVDSKGQIHVSEVETGRLKILGPSGRLVDEFDLSSLRGQRVSPGRVMLNAEGQHFVVDLSSNEILILSPQGSLTRTVGPFAYLQKAGPGPAGETIGLSALGKAVTIVDDQGRTLRSFGEHGDTSGRNVSFPTGFAVDGKERVWIADAFQHRLKVFSMAGRFLFNFGRPEEKTGGFFFPVDLCFGDQGRLYVLEKGANRIQVFRVEDLHEPSDD